MLATIKDITFGIWDFLVNIFDFIAGFFRDIAAVGKYLVTAIGSVPSYLGWFPSAFSALVIVGVGIAVIYKIAGREG